MRKEKFYKQWRMENDRNLLVEELCFDELTVWVVME
jgi:hypothetical protein